MDAALAEAEEAERELARVGDAEGVAWALRLVGNFLSWLGKTREAEQAWARALEHAERAGSSAQITEILNWTAWALEDRPARRLRAARTVGVCQGSSAGAPRRP